MATKAEKKKRTVGESNEHKAKKYLRNMYSSVFCYNSWSARDVQRYANKKINHDFVEIKNSRLGDGQKGSVLFSKYVAHLLIMIFRSLSEKRLEQGDTW